MRKLLVSTERSPRLDRGDRRILWLLTAVYTLIALLNLGTTRFPTSVWHSETMESACIDLGETREVGAIAFNGNIATGRLLITGEDGGSFEYRQEYGEMFSWKKKDVSFHTRYLYLSPMTGDVALNEIAVYGADGKLLPAAAADSRSAALTDEQKTVPETPGYFNGMIFDEIYHARTAYEFIHGMSVYEWTHPPLGKLLIALGVLVFGMTPFGWRIVPALFGAAMLPVMFLLAKRIFQRRDMAFLAQALLALDTMHFTQTRIATVDVFIVFFILWMFYFMAVFLQKDLLHTPWRDLLPPLGACGIAFGLGVASKWTGLYAGAGLALLYFAHLVSVGLSAGKSGEAALFWKRAVGVCLFCIVFFILLPVCIYFLSYIPFFRYESSLRPDYGFSDAVKTVLQQQESMYGYHSSLTATHLCQSNWYEWPFTAKSVWFYYSAGENSISNISSTGSPAVWWISTVAMLCLLVEALFGRLRSASPMIRKAALFLLVGIGADLLPWTLVTRCTFQYHFFPTLPFMILSGVLLLQHLEERGEIPERGKWWWLTLACVYFLLLLPAVSGLPMPKLYAQFLEYVLPTGELFYGAV